MSNADAQVVKDFGDEWMAFDQADLPAAELADLWGTYFEIVPWDEFGPDSVAFDLGCGSGRWAKLVSPRVGHLHLIDASESALAVARASLSEAANCSFHLASVDAIPAEVRECDFGYSLGVLHHVPDTAAALRCCVERVKVGGLFLVYLYYAFDNKPKWFKMVWRASDLLRRQVSRMPFRGKKLFTDFLAASIYYPLARTARFLSRRGKSVENFPLTFYRDRSFYTMRTDALDRFGTRLERRFTKAEVQGLMDAAGLNEIRFGERQHWVAVGRRRS